MSLTEIFYGVSPDCAVVAQKSAAPELLAVADAAFDLEYGVTLDQLTSIYEKQTLATVVPATGQPRLSLQVQRLDFKGNLLRLADGHFVAEKDGELFRLTPEAQFERKLDFTPDRCFLES